MAANFGAAARALMAKNGVSQGEILAELEGEYGAHVAAQAAEYLRRAPDDFEPEVLTALVWAIAPDDEEQQKDLLMAFVEEGHR